MQRTTISLLVTCCGGSREDIDPRLSLSDVCVNKPIHTSDGRHSGQNIFFQYEFSRQLADKHARTQLLGRIANSNTCGAVQCPEKGGNDQ
jgi:hypothetical protein